LVKIEFCTGNELCLVKSTFGLLAPLTVSKVSIASLWSGEPLQWIISNDFVKTSLRSLIRFRRIMINSLSLPGKFTG